MARRKQNVIEDILDIASSSPWWVGVIIAIVSYILFHAIASSVVVPQPTDIKNFGELAGKQLLITFSTIFQYVLPIAALMGALISLIRGMKKKTPNPSNQNNRAYNTYSKQQHSQSNNDCPLCSQPMVKRKSRRGANAGKEFWGCSNYPSCKGTRPL